MILSEAVIYDGAYSEDSPWYSTSSISAEGAAPLSWDSAELIFKKHEYVVVDYTTPFVAESFTQSEAATDTPGPSEMPNVNLVDVYSWVEGTYYQADYYPMKMYLSISSEATSETLDISFLFVDYNGIYGDGEASYVGGNDLPRFEGYQYSIFEPISIEYDGSSFIVNCPFL